MKSGGGILLEAKLDGACTNDSGVANPRAKVALLYDFVKLAVTTEF